MHGRALPNACDTYATCMCMALNLLLTCTVATLLAEQFGKHFPYVLSFEYELQNFPLVNERFIANNS